MKYSAGWNMPGCLPETDPAEFASIEDATEYIRGELLTVIRQELLQDGMSRTERQAWNALAELDPDNEMSWWTPGTPFVTLLVGGYRYWVEETEK